ncbi:MULTISPECIES: DAK2 domain-containing protein [Streptomyces]|uniref:DAK2 domain-containing protein n=1 Tax=Streptomyces koelreuteriae TaxID=2838015 RepID=A0ABX8FNX3_9ACTN|nr:MULTISPECIES: DAK2 domain-containing protein [Streptomyces]QWB22849.1 DAK2 domain-containing protein [Streptomyces koelreuteriae]UUA05796.1 DAK2 domain-containing protein [Streptomyces koelreuteriae]UUA13424.1 DAK2 domain-containing protein [Streptomyces sp. CRCS-T-1]
MAQVPQTFFDALAVRTWCGLALETLGRAREEIDAINVYPVADGDTGTNLYLTVESAVAAVEAVFAGHAAGSDPEGPTFADAARAMAHGALIGARGNSGTILAQLLRGMAQVLADDEAAHADGPGLRLALRHAADSARQAVAHPVEGTVLTVASAAADAADGAEGDCGKVARAAYEGARTALAATPAQLPVLERAGVVDAGGRGLVAVLGALVETFTGETPRVVAAGVVSLPGARASGGVAAAGAVVAEEPVGLRPGPDEDPRDLHARVEPADGPAQGECADSTATAHQDGPAFEVIYLLEAEDAAVARLRGRLDALGDSLVVVGGDGLWNVHVHVDDAGAAVEAGIEAGRPYRIRITHFGAGDVHTTGAERPPRERAQRAVVAVVPGEGLAGLYTESGATTVLARPGEPPASGELVQAVRRAHAREVVLLPNDAELRHTAAAAAEQARTEGIRVALIPTRSAVQGIAALAVHEPERRFDEDVVSMTSAAGATRYAEVTVAERQSWTMAGICQAGDVLGLIDGDVAVIGTDVAATAGTVLDRMLAAGGEMVTLVLGDEAPEAIAEHLEGRVREGYLAVDTVVYRGGRQGSLLLIGVE